MQGKKRQKRGSRKGIDWNDVMDTVLRTDLPEKDRPHPRVIGTLLVDMSDRAPFAAIWTEVDVKADGATHRNGSWRTRM